MIRKIIVVCFDGGKWIQEPIGVSEPITNEPEFIQGYIADYEEARVSNSLLGLMTPVIIHAFIK